MKDGPISEENRECRDCFCCLLFLLNGIAMVVLAIYGYANGNTSDIYRATDNASNPCGQSNSAARDYPLSYFYNPTTDNLDNRVCVKSCPEYNNGQLSNVDCYLNGQVASCAYTVTVAEDGSYNVRNATTADFIGYDSIEVIERVCIPTKSTLENAFKDYSKSISRLLRQEAVANFITDLQEVLLSTLRTGRGCSWRWEWRCSSQFCCFAASAALHPASYGSASSPSSSSSSAWASSSSGTAAPLVGIAL